MYDPAAMQVASPRRDLSPNVRGPERTREDEFCARLGPRILEALDAEVDECVAEPGHLEERTWQFVAGQSADGSSQVALRRAQHDTARGDLEKRIARAFGGVACREEAHVWGLGSGHQRERIDACEQHLRQDRVCPLLREGAGYRCKLRVDWLREDLEHARAEPPDPRQLRDLWERGAHVAIIEVRFLVQRSEVESGTFHSLAMPATREHPHPMAALCEFAADPQARSDVP